MLDCEYQDGWLTVHNAFPLGAPANTTYSFRVKEIRNPHSLAPLVGFEIYLFNDENYFQELKDGVLTVTKPSPPRWVNFTNLNKAVSTLTEISFEIFPDGFVNPDSSFLLGLPDNLNIDGKI